MSPKSLLSFISAIFSVVAIAQDIERDGCYYPPEMSIRVYDGSVLYSTVSVLASSTTTLLLGPTMTVNFDVHGGSLLCWAALSVRRDDQFLDSCTAYHCQTTFSEPGTYHLDAYADGHRTADVIIAQGPGTTVTSSVSISAFLSGAYSAENGRMRADLASMGLLRTTEPFTQLGSADPSSGGESISSAYIDSWSTDPIVDWVRLELLDASTSMVVQAHNALLHSSGTVRTFVGEELFHFNTDLGMYRVALRHRNHLSASSRPLVFPFELDHLAMEAYPGWMDTQNDTRIPVGEVRAVRSGNARLDATHQRISYTGPDNDRDAILYRLGGSNPLNVVSGYYNEDVNMDGVVKYTGVNNDRDVVLQAIGGTVPTAVVHE